MLHSLSGSAFGTISISVLIKKTDYFFYLIAHTSEHGKLRLRVREDCG